MYNTTSALLLLLILLIYSFFFLFFFFILCSWEQTNGRIRTAAKAILFKCNLVLIKNAPRKHECFNNPFKLHVDELKVGSRDLFVMTYTLFPLYFLYFKDFFSSLATSSIYAASIMLFHKRKNKIIKQLLINTLKNISIFALIIIPNRDVSRAGTIVINAILHVIEYIIGLLLLPRDNPLCGVSIESGQVKSI